MTNEIIEQMPSNTPCQQCQDHFKIRLTEPFNITTRMRSYHFPTELEELQIRGILSQIDDESQRLSSDVVHGNITALIAGCHELDRLKISYSSLLSPIRKLPVEVLAHILSLTSESVIEFVYVVFTAIPLFSVCHHWYKVASSTRRLWSHVWLNDTSDKALR